jgi:hypothetical protein
LYNKGSVSKRFVPSNYRGDLGDIRLEMSCDESPHSGLTIQPLAQVALGGRYKLGLSAYNYGSLPGLQDVFTGAGI